MRHSLWIANCLKMFCLPILLFVAAWPCLAASSYSMDNTRKWACAENAGWVNHKPFHGGVFLYNDHLEGYAWYETVGWIRLGTYTGGGTHTYLNTTNANYGVNVDGSGNLYGYAWATNAGWINFNPSHSHVSVDLAAGSFSGNAWSENLGWIKFAGTAKNAEAYEVCAGCPNCSEGDVVLENVTFRANTDCECAASSSVTLGDNVTVQNQAKARVNAPTINFQTQVHVEAGADFKAGQ